MKKRYLMALLAASLMISMTGCGKVNTNVNVNINTNNGNNSNDESDESTSEEEQVGMANPIVEISDDSEYEKQLGIKWDTSFLSNNVSRSIIGNTIAQATFSVENPNGDNVEFTFRGTKDDSVAENPIESLAGIYSQDLSDTSEVEVDIDDGKLTLYKTDANDMNTAIEYFDYDDVHYTVTFEESLSQMTIAEKNDAILRTIGAVVDGSEESTSEAKVVKPLPSELDMNDLNGEYTCCINSVKEAEDGTVTADLEIYTMDLYDAVDITTLQKGDTIVIDGEKIVVDTIEDGDPVELNDADLEDTGSKAVYIINDGIVNGGAELVAYEGGTFRYFGFDDYATYSKAGEVSLPIAEDAVITDHAHDLDNGENNTDGTIIKVSDFKEYFEDDMIDDVSYFNEYNTSVTIENGEITEITRIYTP